ncbi:MAG: DNA polymerase III subunit delta [Oscillospiraceae bacterium]|jgi:DNA polymerase-3 subunit delta|nr:DNA polymerase III subunit delta [Oscillospiraceae bacterium]
MAKFGGNAQKTDYGAVLRELKEKGPGRLYLLWGAEAYLRASFFDEIKRQCLAAGDTEFNHHRLGGAGLTMQRLAEAVDSVPFMGERTLIELRDFELNALKEDDAERFKSIVSDIPEYATLVLLMPPGADPDGRLSTVKRVKKLGKAIEFTTQPQGLLIAWITRRFSALGKQIGRAECERLIFVSGELMLRLIPEIEKIAGYAKGGRVTAEDIENAASRIPEASVFEMTDRLSERNFDKAAALLAELLASGEHPIKTLAMIGFQLRRLYTARIALDNGLGREFVMESHGISYPFLADKLLKAAAGFTKDGLKKAVALCAESDYRMKSASEDDETILKELLLRLAAGG